MENCAGCGTCCKASRTDLYMLRADFNAGIRALKPFGLIYDILIFERHLPQTSVFVDRHPSQVFVLDHIAKPRIKDGAFEPWNTHIRELAKRENVFCKLSGMVTEASWSGWTPEQLRPYVDTVLAAFGPARTMFGSDWPVCLVASGYARWVETVQRFAAGLTADEQAGFSAAPPRRSIDFREEAAACRRQCRRTSRRDGRAPRYR